MRGGAINDPQGPRDAGHQAYPASIQPVSQSLFPGAGAGGLDGTGLVADDLYLLAHDEVTGRPLLGPRPLGIGLAGGLAAELMLGGGIGLSADGRVTLSRRWPADDLARRVQGRIAAEREPVLLRDWLRFFARSATTDVARRIVQARTPGARTVEEAVDQLVPQVRSLIA